MRVLLSLALTAGLLSAGPLGEVSFPAPSCCGSDSPCAPAASAPVPVAIARPAAAPILSLPLVAMPAAFLFDALEREKDCRFALAASANRLVRLPEPSLRL